MNNKKNLSNNNDIQLFLLIISKMFKNISIKLNIPYFLKMPKYAKKLFPKKIVLNEMSTGFTSIKLHKSANDV